MPPMRAPSKPRRRRRGRAPPRTARQRRARRYRAGAQRATAPMPAGFAPSSPARGAPSTCSISAPRPAAPASASTPPKRKPMRSALARLVDAHRRTLDQLSTGVAMFDADQRLTFYNAAYRALWDLDAGFLDQGPTDSAVLEVLRAARQAAGGAGFPAMEGAAARGLSRRRGQRTHLASARRPHLARRHHAQSGRRRDLSVPRRHRAARSRTALRGADPRSGRDARQSCRRRRGVRQRRPPAPAQCRVRAHVAAVARRRWPSGRTSRRITALCQPLHGDAAAWQALRDVVTAIESREAIARPDRTPRRQRGRLHDRAAARRRHAGDVPRRHRFGQCRARAARAQRGARRRRQDQDRFRPPRVLRAALAAHQHHRLRPPA